MESKGHANGSFESDLTEGFYRIRKLSDSSISVTMEPNMPKTNLDAPNNIHQHQNNNPAVLVRNGMKEFKNRKGNIKVLNDFNMTVQQGSIYSLLGSSGCGKTTLLSCCVGVMHMDKGDIRIFGSKPGTRICGVPGRNVGFMPQELALYPEMSIKEILQYFGRMFGMSSSDVNKRMEFLINFLALPPAHRRITSLSGGQKRRVSFAIALVHSPKLLILDEPTVGVDPLLRQSIWNHLVKLVSSGETTVIITTHYIEEAKQSSQIGLMRNGRLLVESEPLALLAQYKTNLMEDIVLKLCKQDNYSENEENSESSTSSSEISEPIPNIIKNDMSSPAEGSNYNKNVNLHLSNNLEERKEIETETVTRNSNGLITSNSSKGNKLENGNHIVAFRSQSFKAYKPIDLSIKAQLKESAERVVAMTYKNFLALMRNIPFLLFNFLLPASQVCIVCIAIGQDPKDLPFGLINEEVPNTTLCNVTPGCVSGEAFNGSLSCRFLEILNSHGTLDLKSYITEEEATFDVELGKIWGYVAFGKNYTESMKERALFGMHAEPGAIYGSRMRFRLDQSNLQIYRETAKVFIQSFTHFIKNVSLDCGQDPIYSELPIHFETPIFGNDSINFTDFLAPSILLAVLFFFPLCGSGISYITEKKTGTLDRSLVAGMKSFEIMIAYLNVQLILLIVQTIVAFAILKLVFKLNFAGPIWLAVILSILVGICGMSLGFLVAALCRDELEAVLLALGSFLPNMFLSGLLWPSQAMPIYLQYFSYILPCTLTGEAMRSILSRGVGFTHSYVWPGFISIGIWIVIYWAVNIVVHKCSRK